MKMLWSAALCALLAVAHGVAVAHDYHVRSLHIDHPFARATPPGATSGGVFFSVENTGTEADTLSGVSTPIAGAAEVHATIMDGNVARMREVPRLDIPAHSKVSLAPGGYHVMLSDLKRPLKVGDRVPMTLTFAKAGKVDVEVVVESLGAGAGSGHAH
jgi:copper(I)-binding protein